MLATFESGALQLVIASCHLLWGAQRPAGKPDDDAERNDAQPALLAGAPPETEGMQRRALEASVVAASARRREDDPHAYTKTTLVLGDFNLPEARAGDPIFDALTSKGLVIPAHSTKVPGSNLGGTKQCDQMAVVPGRLDSAIQQIGIFDFDGAVFADVWGDGSPARAGRFRSCVEYYLSDHRPLWMQLQISSSSAQSRSSAPGRWRGSSPYPSRRRVRR